MENWTTTIVQRQFPCEASTFLGLDLNHSDHSPRTVTLAEAEQVPRLFSRRPVSERIENGISNTVCLENVWMSALSPGSIALLLIDQRAIGLGEASMGMLDDTNMNLLDMMKWFWQRVQRKCKLKHGNLPVGSGAEGLSGFPNGSLAVIASWPFKGRDSPCLFTARTRKL
ncbi:hypothetical protein B566_EDAN018932 [Ephemera danica]|nr:hypothetical protein B566_EDAN018932 [Ephemera danica]